MLLCGLCETRPAYAWGTGALTCIECAVKYFPDTCPAPMRESWWPK